MRTHYGHKKDANHKAIVEVLEAAGVVVLDLSMLGAGVPDTLCWVKWPHGGSWQLAEIKNKNTAYGRRGANKNQLKWALDWRGGPVYILCNDDDALAFARGDLESLEVIA